MSRLANTTSADLSMAASIHRHRKGRRRGVDWHLSPQLGLRFDGRLAIYESYPTGYLEDSLDLTVGAVWRF